MITELEEARELVDGIRPGNRRLRRGRRSPPSPFFSLPPSGNVRVRLELIRKWSDALETLGAGTLSRDELARSPKE